MKGVTASTPDGETFVVQEEFSREEFCAISMKDADGGTNPDYTNYVVPARQAYGIKATDTSVYLLCPNAVECYGFDGVQNWVQDNFSARPIQVLKASELLVFTGSRAEVLTPPDNANNTSDS